MSQVSGGGVTAKEIWEYSQRETTFQTDIYTGTYPKLADGVLVTLPQHNNLPSTAEEVIPANTITSDFVITGMYVANPNTGFRRKVIKIQLCTGSITHPNPYLTVTFQCLMYTTGGYFHPFPLKTVPANSRVLVRGCCDGEGNATCRIKLIYAKTNKVCVI